MLNSALVRTDPQNHLDGSSSGDDRSVLGRVAVLRSPKRLARIAGLLYLTVAVFGTFAHVCLCAARSTYPAMPPPPPKGSWPTPIWFASASSPTCSR